MELDLKVITLTIQTIVYAIIAASFYWRLRMSIRERPNYEKTEQMISNRTVSREDFDNRVIKVVDDRSVSKVEFQELKNDVRNIKDGQLETKNMLQQIIDYFKRQTEKGN